MVYLNIFYPFPNIYCKMVHLFYLIGFLKFLMLFLIFFLSVSAFSKTFKISIVGPFPHIFDHFQLFNVSKKTSWTCYGSVNKLKIWLSFFSLSSMQLIKSFYCIFLFCSLVRENKSIFHISFHNKLIHIQLIIPFSIPFGIDKFERNGAKFFKRGQIFFKW